MLTMTFAEGKAGILVLRGKRFLCEIAEIDGDLVRLRFPLVDIPIEGMAAVLEFYDETGCTCFSACVVEVPEDETGRLVLRYSLGGARAINRAWWRVPGDFAVQIKHHVHPWQAWAPVNDIGLGGMQIETAMDLAEGDTLDVLFSLPGTTAIEKAMAEAAHVSPSVIDERGTRQIGLRFLCLDARLRTQLKEYLKSRVRSLYPEDFMQAF